MVIYFKIYQRIRSWQRLCSRAYRSLTMLMLITWTKEAWEDYLYWQKEDKKTLNKINDLIKSIDRNGYECEGKPEALKGDWVGFYSVRIDKKNRLVFKIVEDTIEIFQCGSHYKDK